MIDPVIAIFGLSAFVFALLVALLRQPMRSALALIGHMMSLAALFAALGVHAVALFQVLIYVGAVMVLMIYTIMLLDERDSSYVHLFSRWAAPAFGVVTLAVLALRPLFDAPAKAAVVNEPAAFRFADFSIEFMARYWFHFELATVLLLVSIVAVWTVIAERR